MTYTSEKPANPETSDELRARIPGWGADLDPRDRPAVPRLDNPPDLTGPHWHFPDRQRERRPRERSIEHEFLTPVFGTSAPLRGLSGTVRRLAYRRFSEGRAAHWLLLIAGDRIDVAESRVEALLRGKPDLVIPETGLHAEIGGHGLASRRGRVDRRHQWLDPIIVTGPRAVRLLVGYLGVRALVRSVRGR